ILESVHISAHVIYSVLTQEALNPCVECTSGLVGGEGLSITFKLGLKRSIQHIWFSRTTVIKMARSHGIRRFEDRDRRRLSKKIRFLAPPNYIIHDCAERVLTTASSYGIVEEVVIHVRPEHADRAW